MKKGTVILIPFPFTDLTGSKIRPAVVLTHKLNKGLRKLFQLE